MIQAAVAPAPRTNVRTTATRRASLSASAAASEAAATTATTAKAVSTALVSCTASGYAEKDEGERDRDDGHAQRLQRALWCARDGLGVERDDASVGALDVPRDHSGAAPDLANRRREHALRPAEQSGEQGGEQRRAAQRVRACEVRGQHRERAPAEREPRIAVQAAAEELEVVGDDESGSGRNEDEKPEIALHGDDDSDRCGGGDRRRREGDQRPGWDQRLQRAPAQLIERVRADTHREEEREQRPAEQVAVKVRRQGGADHDVRKVPRRIRRMNEGYVIAPAARCKRVERGPRLTHL